LTPAQPPGAWRRLLESRTALASASILALVALFAIFGLAIFHADPETPTQARYFAPSAQHFFGTDVNGRDLFGRVIEGARISLVVGFSGAIISFVVGAGYGMIAGYVGGRTDALMMRLVEILYAIPRLIIIILAVAIYDPELKRAVAPFMHGDLVGYTRVLILILALGLIEWLSMARIVRGQVLSLKSQTFVSAARAIGQSHVRIILYHILPNLIGIVIVYLTLTIPAVILDESFLSFLGLGIQPPQASWGTLLSDGASVINPVKSYWWLLVYPAVIMAATLLALNFLGDALRDAFDPRGSGR
jgi:oligopeptide transport system permease protein